MVLIKRYANRKLYNTESSRYITLKGIAELIEQGREVRVVDNESGEDITSIALSQILVDSERESRNVPGSVLSELISKGGDALYTALRRGVGDTWFHAADGRPWFRMDEHRRDVSLAQIAPELRNAFVAVEDHRFYSHFGIDPIGLGRAPSAWTVRGLVPG